MTTNNDSNFIGRIVGSLRDCQTGLEEIQVGMTAYMSASVPLSQSLEVSA